MNTVYGGPGEGDLGYVPPRQVSFGWIGESLNLFGASAGVWILGTLIAFGLPYLLLFLFNSLLGNPMDVSASGNGGTHQSPSSGLSVFLVVLELFFYASMIFFCGSLYRMANQQVRGRTIIVRDIFRGGPIFGRTLGYSLLFSLAYLGMDLICFVPFGLALAFSIRATAHAAWASPHTLGPAVMGTMLADIGWFLLGLVLALAAGLVLLGLLLPGYALVADGEQVFASWRRSIQAMRGQWMAAAGLVFVMGLLIFVSELPCGLGLLVTLPMFFLMTALAYRDMVGMPGLVIRAPVYAPPQPGVWPPPPAMGQAPPGPSPPPTWGPPPGQSPPRRSLSGEPLDDDPPPGTP